MSKLKVYYCSNCNKQTKHILIHKEKIGTGCGPLRALLAVATLGLSESTFGTLRAEYECANCGRISTHHD